MIALINPDFTADGRTTPHMNMKMLKITRTKDAVRFRHEVQIDAGGIEERDITAHEAPLKKFDDALQALAAVAAKTLECDPEWANSCVVHTLALSYTKHGTRSATISFTKGLDATSTQHAMSTPMFQIEDCVDKKEATRRQCAPKHAEAVLEMIKRAEDYANGKRQQMQLPFESAEEKAKREGREKADKAGDTGTLKFPAGSSGAGD